MSRVHCCTHHAGTVALGLAAEGVAAAPADVQREPHPKLRRLARLYAPRPKHGGSGAEGKAAENGNSHGSLRELEGASGSPGLEAAVLQEWLRIRSSHSQPAR